MLNVNQIENIEKQVHLASISFSHLADDLIDHICCDVENRMNNGETFDQAFEKVKVEIGMEGLKNIQEQGGQRAQTGLVESIRLPGIYGISA